MRKSNLALLGVAVARACSTSAKKLGDSMLLLVVVAVCRLRAKARESRAKKTKISFERDIVFSI